MNNDHKLYIANYKICPNRGQSLFEVVFAIAIAAILVVGVVALAATSVRNSASARNDSLAKNYAEEAGEWLREERDKDWVSFKDNARGVSYLNSTNWCLKALSWSSPSKNSACASDVYLDSTIFIRNATFTCFNTNPPAIACSDTSVNLIEATIVVSWSDTQGAHEVRTVTYLANWRI